MLTTLLAGPFMAFFANLIDLNTSLHVLDRVILQKSSAFISIIQHILSLSEMKIK